MAMIKGGGTTGTCTVSAGTVNWYSRDPYWCRLAVFEYMYYSTPRTAAYYTVR